MDILFPYRPILWLTGLEPSMSVLHGTVASKAPMCNSLSRCGALLLARLLDWISPQCCGVLCLNTPNNNFTPAGFVAGWKQLLALLGACQRAALLPEEPHMWHQVGAGQQLLWRERMLHDYRRGRLPRCKVLH